MDLGISGNSAIVAASSSGLGRAAAAALAGEGANVVMNGCDEERLGAAVADVREVATGEVVGQPGDLTEADGGGTVVCSTSYSVKEAVDNLVLSNAVRMSVIGLEKTLSRELAPEVRVNAVLPGVHETDRIEYLIRTAVDQGEHENYEEGYDAWTDGIPQGRLGPTDEFGDIVAFLSSERSSFINGESVLVDGGDARSNL